MQTKGLKSWFYLGEGLKYGRANNRDRMEGMFTNGGKKKVFIQPNKLLSLYYSFSGTYSLYRSLSISLSRYIAIRESLLAIFWYTASLSRPQAYSYVQTGLNKCTQRSLKLYMAFVHICNSTRILIKIINNCFRVTVWKYDCFN